MYNIKVYRDVFSVVSIIIYSACTLPLLHLVSVVFSTSIPTPTFWSISALPFLHPSAILVNNDVERDIYSQSSSDMKTLAASPTSTLSCPPVATTSTVNCSTSSSTSSSTIVTDTIADVCVGLKIIVLELIAS